MKKLYTILTALFMLSFFTAQAQSVLLVADASYKAERVEPLKTALADLGYNYSFYDAQAEAASPTAEFMKSFDLVIWYTSGNNHLYFWNNEDTDNLALKSYLDDGGMLWIQGVDFLKDRYGNAPDTFKVGDFAYDYLGIEYYIAQSHVDDGVFSNGVPFFEVVPDNGIFTLDTLKWAWSTLWNADAVGLVDGATPLYKMGPEEYDLAGMTAAHYYEKDSAKIMSFSITAGKLDAQWRLDTLYAQGLRYFKQFAKKEVTKVESITLSTDGDKTKIDTKGGSLQFSVTVLPEDATDKNVIWSLENNTCYASIDQSGLLVATPLSMGNGTVTVVATAADGSDVKASMEITIENQGSADDYEVLLVADGNWGGSGGLYRHLELDTALINNNINHTIFNINNEGTIPTQDYLNNFDVVIWYTSNDQTNLGLWDVSDSTNIKFNAPLVSYVDNGGLLWVLGTDYLFDIYGYPPHDEFKAGDFVYDYLGIKTYVAKSHSDADNTLGVPQLDVVPDNGICELTPLQWSYTTMWRVDAYVLTDNAVGIYKMGPTDYPLSDFYAMMYNTNGKSKIITSSFEAARMDDQDNLDQLFEEVLDFYESITNDVTEIDGYASDINIYPNPAKDYTTLNYELAKKAKVQVAVYSLDGQKVYGKNIGIQVQGANSITIPTDNLGNGNYICIFRVDNKQIAKKITVIK